MSARLVSIVVYPIKSCRGIALDRAQVEKRGLALDRRWMWVDAEGRFVTQREEPRLCLVDVAVEGDALVMSATGAGEVRLPVTTEDGARITVEIWGRRVGAVVHEGASAWASAYLGRALRVVHLPASVPSPSASRRAQPGDEVSFADGYPLLVATTASLDDLSARIVAHGREAVPMERFRPNIVVAGTPPWDEDGWDTLRVGAVRFRAPKPCERCVMTTIEPATAKAGPEPLRTLASFRRREQGVWFGVNLVPDDVGPLAVGDAVEVLTRTAPPAFDPPGR